MVRDLAMEKTHFTDSNYCTRMEWPSWTFLPLKYMYNNILYCCNFCPLQSGGDCMILPSVSAEDATKLFPGFKSAEVPSGKSYIRTTSQPK